MATATYPQDEKARQELLAVIRFQTILERKDSSPHDRLILDAKNLLPDLLEARPPEQVFKSLSEVIAEGWVAGTVLLRSISARVHHQELRTSTTRIIHALELTSRNLKTLSGKPVFSGERTLWEKWRRFKPAAHFHAYYRYLIGRAAQEAVLEAAHTFMRSSADADLRNLLAHAEAFRLLAEQMGIVSAGECWSVPKDLVLPAVSLEIPPLPPAFLAALRNYRAPNSRMP